MIKIRKHRDKNEKMAACLLKKKIKYLTFKALQNFEKE